MGLIFLDFEWNRTTGIVCREQARERKCESLDRVSELQLSSFLQILTAVISSFFSLSNLKTIPTHHTREKPPKYFKNDANRICQATCQKLENRTLSQNANAALDASEKDEKGLEESIHKFMLPKYEKTLMLLEGIYRDLLSEDFCYHIGTLGSSMDLFFLNVLLNHVEMADFFWERCAQVLGTDPPPLI